MPGQDIWLPSERATQIVKERGKTYGDPTPIAITTCALWNDWLELPGVTDPEGLIRAIDPRADYGIMLALHKLARHRHSPDHEDHVDDVAGYMNVHRMIERSSTWEVS